MELGTVARKPTQNNNGRTGFLRADDEFVILESITDAGKFSGVRRVHGNHDPKDVANLAELVPPIQCVRVNFNH
ncbi:hypothetical protein TRICI_006840 [Trichomonascus ciferrii]|uniref:Uncharacterized protein n=1 Tax=Trichomonascus ciferrii TaxID=44093 RepID=A0A642UCN3_9ASCO|nr:hypothetical protein TRICI_006840 [Trichomonascus ciferrii]